MSRNIISAIGLLLAGVIFFMYTQPTYDNTQELRTQIDSYNQALTKAAELQQLKQTLLSRFNSFNPADLDRIQKLLPDHVDNVRLILDLDSLASSHEMALSNVDISGNVEQTGAQTVGTIGDTTQKYESLTIRFSTDGTYSDFNSFLTDLEASLRIVDIQSLNVTPAGATAISHVSNSVEPVYHLGIVLKTYWLK